MVVEHALHRTERPGTARAGKWLRGAALPLLALWLAMAGMAADTTPSIPQASPEFARRTPRYRIQVNDVLVLSFRFTPEFNQTLTVQPDGFVSLMDVGDLKVSGLNLEQVRRAVIEKYRGILKAPVVTVVLKKFHAPTFIVGGEVAHPGRFELTGDLTIADAIALAGGFTVGAKSTEVLLFRRVSAKTVEVKKVNVKLAQHGRAEANLVLQPGDSIFVPRSRVGKLNRFMSITRLGLYFPLPGL